MAQMRCRSRAEQIINPVFTERKPSPNPKKKRQKIPSPVPPPPPHRLSIKDKSAAPFVPFPRPYGDSLMHPISIRSVSLLSQMIITERWHSRKTTGFFPSATSDRFKTKRDKNKGGERKKHYFASITYGRHWRSESLQPVCTCACRLGGREKRHKLGKGRLWVSQSAEVPQASLMEAKESPSCDDDWRCTIS